MAFDCLICQDNKDDTEKRITPCCQAEICADCIAASSEAVVRYQGDRYYCSLCHNEVTDPDQYENIVPADTVAAMKTARSKLEAVVNVVTVADSTLRENAWQFGAYTHSPGCGSAVSVVEGCDTLKCPTCSVQINIAGGQVGEHTFLVEAFFRDVKKFSAKTAANQLDTLRSSYPTVWEARYLTELTDGIRDGSLVGWIDSMADYVWGDFREFLRQRIAPRAQGPSENSLFALIASIGADSPDGRLLSAHYHEVEKPKTLSSLEINGARRKVAGEMSDTQVSGILKTKFSNDKWWLS